MASTKLARTAGTPTLNTKYTISVWVKRCEITFADSFILDGYVDASNRFKLAFAGSDKLEYYNTHSGSNTFNILTTRVFRDNTSWMHIVLSVDTTQGTAADRVKLYINGIQQDAFDTDTYPSQDEANNVVNESGATISIGDYQGGSNGFDGLMSQFIFIDGTAYAASTFGSTDSTSGEWKPNANPSVTYGNNGFNLSFETDTALGDDTSGNTNDFTMSGTGTQTQDCPSNNYTTFNTLNYTTISGIQSNGIQNGNTFIATSTSNSNFSFGSLLAFPGTGKFYIEFKVGNLGGDYALGIGEVQAMQSILSNGAASKFCNNAKGWGYLKSGNKENGGSGGSYGDTYANYDYIGIAYNNGALWFSKNGTWQNSATATEIANGTTTYAAYSGIDTSASYFMMFDGFNDSMCEMNTGNGYFRTTQVGSPNNPSTGDTSAKFKYAVPTGLQPLTTKGLNT